MKLSSIIGEGGPISTVLSLLIGEPQSRLASFIAKRIDLLRVADKAQNDAAMAQVPGAMGDGFSSSNGYAIYMRVDRPPV